MSEADPCAREIVWGEQTYTLNLNHPWVRKVLSLRGIKTGNYSIEDVERVLELGLIASMPEREADKLLDAHVRNQPIAPNATIAADLLLALYTGKPANANASA
jgi:hypothetical protein